MIYKSFDNASICPTRIVWLRVVKKRKVKRGSLIEEVWSSTRVFTRGSFLWKQKLFRAFLFRPFVVIADRGDCEFYCPFDSNRNSWAICSKIRLKCLIFGSCYDLRGNFYDKTHYRSKDKSEESNEHSHVRARARSGLKMDNSCEDPIPMETINLGPVKWILHEPGFSSFLVLPFIQIF